MALNLMCASGADVSDATATASNVLDGKTFYAGTDEGIKTGTMVDNGAKTATLSPGGSYTIPAGYHNGAGKVTANSVTLSGNAGTGQVLSGYTFYKDNYSTKLTGTMANRGSISATLNPGGSKSYSAGYYSGGTVTCNSAESTIKYITFHATYGATRNGDIYTYSVGNKIIGVSWMEDSTDSNCNRGIKYLNISGNTMKYRVDGGGYPLRRFTVAYI